MKNRCPAKSLLPMVAACCVLILTGCFNRSSGIELSPTPDLALGSDWALVVEPYALLRVSPELDAQYEAHCRRGDVIQITGKRITLSGKKQIVWYQFESGWLPSSSVQVFSNRMKAETAANEMGY